MFTFSPKRADGQRAFTLIELLVVILIVGILIAVALPAFLGQADKARDNAAQQHLMQVAHAAGAIYTERNAWPVVGDTETEGTLLYELAKSEPGKQFRAYRYGEFGSLSDGTLVISARLIDAGRNLQLCNQSETERAYCVAIAPKGGLQVASATPDDSFWPFGAEVAYAADNNVTTQAYATGANELYARNALPRLSTGGVFIEERSSERFVSDIPPLPVVFAPEVMSPPVIIGLPAVGEILTGVHGTFSWELDSDELQWQRCDASGSSCDDIPGATGDLYTVTTDDIGSTIRIEETATNDAGSVEVVSLPTDVVPAPLPAMTTPPTITGWAHPEFVVRAQGGTYSHSPTSTSLQWQRCDHDGNNCADIAGATGAEYRVQYDDLGSFVTGADLGTLRVVETATNAAGSTTATSATKGTEWTRFVDLAYKSAYEVRDPLASGSSADCAAYRATRSASCTNHVFAAADTVSGAMHTDDDLLYCGTPTFGRNAADNISVAGPSPGQARASSCSVNTSPTINGTFRSGQASLQLPPVSFAGLKSLTTSGTGHAAGPSSGYRLSGTQYVRLNGNSMVIDTPSGNPVSVPAPQNGVVYVQANGTCTRAGAPNSTSYGDSAGCADLYISGQTSRSLTFVADGDVIVAPTTAYAGTNPSAQFNPATATGSDAALTVAGTVGGDGQVSGNVRVSLVAGRHARIYRRMNGSGGSATHASGVRSVRVDAVIIAPNGSLVADNWSAGPVTGALTVRGGVYGRYAPALAGVGASGALSSGYSKTFIYDNRLQRGYSPRLMSYGLDDYCTGSPLSCSPSGMP